MKKSIKIMGIAAMVLLLAVSCKKENKNGFNGETKFMTFSAGISQGDGKTCLDGLNLLWSDGDQIKINNNAPFTLTNGAGSSKGEFEGEAEEAETYYAVYPASSTLNDGTATITLPAVQPYVAGSFDKGIAPMVAKTDDSKAFTFTNVCGLLRLNMNIAEEAPVKRIVLQSVANEDLAGTGTVEIVGDGTEKLAIDPEKGSGKEVAVTSEAGITGESQIVFVLPAGTLTDGFNVYFYGDTEGTGQLTSRSTTSSDFVIQAGTMNEVTVGNKVVRDPIALAISPEPKPTSEMTYPTLPDTYGIARLDYTSKNNFDSDYQSINLPDAGSKDKTIEVELTSLTPCTKYIVRLVVDSEITFTLSFTTACDDPVPDGKLSGLFSVSADKKVYFSNGNLYFDGSSWKFESNQYDYRTYVGKNSCINGEIKTDGTPTGNWGLFGWSTTNTNNPYGMTISQEPSDYSGDFLDWGNNTISNVASPTKPWRTLSDDEWYYLLNTRKVNGGSGIGKTWNWATVKGINGIIIYCDDYTNKTPNTDSDGIPDGCAFLPAAGERGFAYDEVRVYQVGSEGYYWASTCSNASNIWNLKFYNTNLNAWNKQGPWEGLSVRLVTDAN